MLHHNNCPLCNSNEITPFLNCTDLLVSREEFELYRCINCSFIFTGDYPGENEAGKYYESPDYISHTDSGRTAFEKAYHLARRIMLASKRNLVIKGSGIKEGAILDIGCGTGHFLNSMKSRGWKASGIEINDNARKYAVSRFGLDVISPRVISSLTAKSFDCITLWHVAEHLYDLFGYFNEISRLVKPGGTVIVALPNCSSFDSAHYSRYWAAWDVPRHLWHFDPVTFSIFAEKTGYKVTSVKPLPFDVFYISILSERQKQRSAASIMGLSKGIWFSLLTLFNKKRGSSVVYLLKRKADQ